MFQAAPPAKMMEDGKIHTVEHIINPIAVQQDPASAAAAAAAAAAAVIPAVSTPPPFQVSSALKSCSPHIPLPICPTSHPSCFPYTLLCTPVVGEEPGLLPCSRSRDVVENVTVPNSPAVHLTCSPHYGGPKSRRKGRAPNDNITLTQQGVHCLPFHYPLSF